MKKDINLYTADEIMNLNTIMDSKTWRSITESDPTIQKSEKKLNEVLDQIQQCFHPDVFEALEEALLENRSSFETAAVLYGMHVAFTMKDIASRPAELSTYVQERVEARQLVLAPEELQKVIEMIEDAYGKTSWLREHAPDNGVRASMDVINISLKTAIKMLQLKSSNT